MGRPTHKIHNRYERKLDLIIWAVLEDKSLMNNPPPNTCSPTTKILQIYIHFSLLSHSQNWFVLQFIKVVRYHTYINNWERESVYLRIKYKLMLLMTFSMKSYKLSFISWLIYANRCWCHRNGIWEEFWLRMQRTNCLSVYIHSFPPPKRSKIAWDTTTIFIKIALLNSLNIWSIYM